MISMMSMVLAEGDWFVSHAGLSINKLVVAGCWLLVGEAKANTEILSCAQNDDIRACGDRQRVIFF